MQPIQVIPNLPIERPFFAKAADKCRFRLIGESARFLISSVSAITTAVRLIFAHLNILRNKQQRAASILYWKLHCVHISQEWKYSLFGLLPLLFRKVGSRPLSSEWAVSQTIVKATTGLTEDQKSTFLSHRFIGSETPLSFAQSKRFDAITNLLQNYGFNDRNGIIASIEIDTKIPEKARNFFLKEYRNQKSPDLLHIAFQSGDLSVVQKVLALQSSQQIETYITSHKEELSKFSEKSLHAIAISINCTPLLDFVEDTLMEACKKGDIAKVRSLVHHHLPANRRHHNQGKNSYLWQACHAGHYEVVKLLLAAGASIVDANEVAPGELPLIHDLGMQYAQTREEKIYYDLTICLLLSRRPDLASAPGKGIIPSPLAFFMLQNGLPDHKKIPKENFYPIIKDLICAGAPLNSACQYHDGQIYRTNTLMRLLPKEDRNALLDSLTVSEIFSSPQIQLSVIESLCRHPQKIAEAIPIYRARGANDLFLFCTVIFSIARKERHIGLLDMAITQTEIFDTEEGKQRFLEALRTQPTLDPLALALQQNFSSSRPHIEQQRKILNLCKGSFLGGAVQELSDSERESFLTALQQQPGVDPLQIAVQSSSPIAMYYLLCNKSTAELRTFIANLTTQPISDEIATHAFKIALSEGWVDLVSTIIDSSLDRHEFFVEALQRACCDSHLATRATAALVIYERGLTESMYFAFGALYTSGNLEHVPPINRGTEGPAVVPIPSCLGVKATDEEVARLLAIFRKHPAQVENSAQVNNFHNNFLLGILYIWGNHNLLKPEDRHTQIDAFLNKLETLTSEQFYECFTEPHAALNRKIFQYPCWIGASWHGINTTKDFIIKNPEITLFNIWDYESEILRQVSFLDKNLILSPGMDGGGLSNEFLFILLNSLLSGGLERMIKLTAIVSTDPNSMKIPEYRTPLRVQLTPSEEQKLSKAEKAKKLKLLQLDAKRQEKQLCLDSKFQSHIYIALGYVFAQCFLSSLDPENTKPLITGQFFNADYFFFLWQLCSLTSINSNIFDDESTISEQDKILLTTYFVYALYREDTRVLALGEQSSVLWDAHKNKIRAALYIADGIKGTLNDVQEAQFLSQNADELCRRIQGEPLNFADFKERLPNCVFAPDQITPSEAALGLRLLRRWFNEHSEDDAKDLCFAITGTKALSLSLKIHYVTTQSGAGTYFTHSCSSALELSIDLLRDRSLKDENERYMRLSMTLADAIAQSKSENSYNTR